MTRFISAVSWLFALFGSVALAASSPSDRGQAPKPVKLAVLFKQDVPGLPRAEDIVEVLTSQNASNDALAGRVGNPSGARLMVQRRLDPAYRQGLGEEHPEELLQRYIVLEYPTTESAMAAKTRLQKDSDVMHVEESRFATFAAVPADPLYSVGFGGVPNWQWGINNPLNLQVAWDNVRGTAFLAHLDNGVRVGHEDLGQPFRNFNFNVAGGTDVDEHPEQLIQPGFPNGFAGHGTHTAGIMAAATSQQSVSPGYPNPAPPAGGAGVCWYCNLMVARVSRVVAGPRLSVDATTDVPNAVNWAVASGAQGLNMSFEGPNPDCGANPNASFCLALDFAARRHVTVVSAAGNSDVHVGGTGNALGANVAFPASHPQSIAVGAIQSYAGTRGNLWTEETPQTQFHGSSTGPVMAVQGILAPGRDVLSSFYDNQDWNAPLRCGITQAQQGPRYGPCTGTSMAAPHITGIVGLMRSVNPLLSSSTIRGMLLNAGDNASAPNSTRGYGVVNAGTAVNAVLAQTNRLTPLLSLSGSGANFYTVVPQQARAAAAGTLLPAGTPAYVDAGPGNTISEYPGYPDPPSNPLARFPTPIAQVWLFSTFRNPFNTGVELLPLYRLSWKCGNPGRTATICSSFPQHVNHAYTTSLSEAGTLIGQGFAFEGIEGYVLPTSLPQPAGTVQLRRAFNPTWDTYALYDISQESYWLSSGYSGQTTLGYAYPNQGSRPSY